MLLLHFFEWIGIFNMLIVEVALERFERRP